MTAPIKFPKLSDAEAKALREEWERIPGQIVAYPDWVELCRQEFNRRYHEDNP